MAEMYGCLDFAIADITSSTPPPPPPSRHHHHHHHHPLIGSPLPPPPNSSLISPDDDFASFSSPSFRDHRPMFGSEPSSFISVSSAMSDAASAAEIQDGDFSSALRARVAAHPLYPRLVEAYIDCQKVGAPPKVAYVLDEIRRRDNDLFGAGSVTTCFGADPELDYFMESYCDILATHRSDLAKPFHEATSYLFNMKAQLSNLCNCNGASLSHVSEEAAGSSEEDLSGGEYADTQFLRTSVDLELKDKLLRKYSGYISSLKHEFSKKKKKEKLPKDAKIMLLGWWRDHYKWPYPTEADKIALAECTGLDQKQINNWFINQRKRHWKTSENMQFAVMDIGQPLVHK